MWTIKYNIYKVICGDLHHLPRYLVSYEFIYKINYSILKLQRREAEYNDYKDRKTERYDGY